MLSKEIWKDIPGYEGLYLVSNYGQIKSLISGKFIKHNIIPNGYHVVHLYRNGRRKALYVHRIVAGVFIDNPNNLSDVDHINEDKNNNSVDNLQWLSNRDNTRKSQKKEIIRIDAQGNEIRYEALMDAVREGFNKRGIWRCLNGVRKTHRGYSWVYA